MKSKLLWALAVLNVMLVVIFVGRMTRDNTAMAQQARRVGDVLAIPAEAMEERSGVVFLLDTSNGQLGGMVYNSSRGNVDMMPPLDLARLFETGAALNTNPGGNKPGRR